MVNYDIKHFRTPLEFQSYVNTLIKPSWFTHIITHHTAIPTVIQWQGYRSVVGALNYYIGTKGWSRFPHIFVAPDGIWTMNKLTERGIHANAANPFSIGIEVVGNYDTLLWQEPILTYAMEAHATLVRWGNIPLDNIEPHRKYNLTKTCPGTAIGMPWVKSGVHQVLSANNKSVWRVVADVINIRQGPNVNYQLAGKLYKNDEFISEAVKLDEHEEFITGVNGKTNTWAHITTANIRGLSVSGIGFVHTSNLMKIG